MCLHAHESSFGPIFPIRRSPSCAGHAKLPSRTVRCPSTPVLTVDGRWRVMTVCAQCYEREHACMLVLGHTPGRSRPEKCMLQSGKNAGNPHVATSGSSWSGQNADLQRNTPHLKLSTTRTMRKITMPFNEQIKWAMALHYACVCSASSIGGNHTRELQSSTQNCPQLLLLILGR